MAPHLLNAKLGCNLKVKESRLSLKTQSDIQALLKYPPKPSLQITVVYSHSISLSPWMCLYSLYPNPVQLPSCVCLLLIIPLSSHSHIMSIHPSPHPFLLCTGSALPPCSSFSPAVLAKQGHSSPETSLVDPEFHARTHSLLPIILPLSLQGFFVCFFEIGSGLQTFICSNTQRNSKKQEKFVGQAWLKRICLGVRNN